IFNASIACDVNMRVFEALATGRPLVTNREAAANGLFELFEDGVHLIGYDDEDLVSQVRRYLDDPGAAEAIGEAGRREVLERHTYAHRVNEIFEVLRAHHLDVGNTRYTRIRTGGPMRDLIPTGALRVLDIGLGLDASRIAMRRRGVEYVAGVALDEAGLGRRAKSYDALWAVDAVPAPTGDFDTVLWTVPGRCGASIDGMLLSSREWLVEGGRVLFFIEEDELREAVGEPTPSALATWLRGKGCHLLMYCQSTAGVPFHLITVSLVVMSADEVNTAMYREFPANGVDAEPWVGGATPAPEPDSPAVEGP
ncbi:MAG: glycosyltransferase, partial [Candidatus Hydrogenedentes bacterium]|nr:glycosyltransferase [Candidatus Hydrogenedentota bacterium]